ncbi:alpha/beta hydrolase [Streptacidiphilus pinicola]|uniref:Alpha/beta hydrolase n=1 Tax=Streptacidiphilus pinicola TaxID=2219663 RepID=A0A2X0IPX2_9ACTN|nr:alpha/beta hydrolase [Streptacidiphilus pinicola]RAG87262.1 alpha/beta hydrolase [Streptacidiphilus pinicola]
MHEPDWQPDILGDGYVQHTIDLGTDPDGEGSVAAVLVRREPRPDESVRGALLYVHGFSDYFFQTELADFAAARGLAFYALDLRKCGRARRAGQTAHYVSDLALYDAELERSLAVVAEEHPGLPVVLMAHSTGGLVLPLWLDRRRAAGRVAPVAGLVLNSPWFDLQGKPFQRGPLTQALRVLARVAPLRPLSLPPSTVYGDSVHVGAQGEWDFDTELKPLSGFPVTHGWLNAVRRGHARLHKGLDVGVPSLVLRSDRSHWARTWSKQADRADTVLDVEQIARWSGCLGGETTVVPIPGARHDVVLSERDARERAYAEMGAWLDRQPLTAAETDDSPETDAVAAS